MEFDVIGPEFDVLATAAPECNPCASAANAPAKKIAVLTSMRNEGLAVLEWVAYYRCLRVDTIFVYTNDNTDGSDRLLDVLARHGVIQLARSTSAPGVSPQLKAFRHAFNHSEALWQHDWVAMLDADEFVVPLLGGDFIDDLPYYLGEIERRFGASALCLNWKWFSGDLSFSRSAGTTLERFAHSVNNDHVKTLFRLRHTADIASSHSVTLHKGRYAIDGRGRSVPLPRSKSETDYSLGQINHYWQKSFEEYVIKRERGSGAQGSDRVIRSVDNFFEWWGSGESDPLPPAAFVERVGAEMTMLRALPDVAEAESAVERQVEAYFLSRRAELSTLYREALARHVHRPELARFAAGVLPASSVAQGSGLPGE